MAVPYAARGAVHIRPRHCHPLHDLLASFTGYPLNQVLGCNTRVFQGAAAKRAAVAEVHDTYNLSVVGTA
ncbi:hypothetical protein CFC21_084677 [Triticum aestivum]|uniref:Uncharacterized protein n=3 Tax=Triticum TaxID=4564 RepID=A0A9R1B3B6_TRITD|nr:hypothetical protein CFC21_084677 [Triticum aestivum]VAI49932.1 unnamed protein product [Triticum turgidum subsp. durum]